MLGAALPTVLIADMKVGSSAVGRVFDGAARVVTAESNEEAERLFFATRPDAVLIGYHFDGLRPYRLIRSLRDSELGAHVPIVLVRALNLDLAVDSVHQVRSAYRQMGADDFICLLAEQQTRGSVEAALAFLRETTLGWAVSKAA